MYDVYFDESENTLDRVYGEDALVSLYEGADDFFGEELFDYEEFEG
ncbi:MAG: hypothetical protein ACQEQV_11225 [Fibrobacterota bacterium]